VAVSAYLDAELLQGTDLIVQCWTMGTITAEQLAGLSAAIRVGTGFAGWHGGIVDVFHAEPAYHLITGGQFLHHPKGFVGYELPPVPGNAQTDEMIIRGLTWVTR
jgi:type 1 glutamine amidotransferase